MTRSVNNHVARFCPFSGKFRQQPDREEQQLSCCRRHLMRCGVCFVAISAMGAIPNEMVRKFDRLYEASAATEDDDLRMWRDKLYLSCGVHQPGARQYEAERITVAWRVLEQEGLAGKLVLDYGCGSAKAAVVFTQSGARVVGFDLSASSVGLGKRRARVNGVEDRLDLLIASGERLPFSSGSFDLVFGYEILFYLNGKADFGSEILRVLKPQGKAVFCEALGGNPLLTAVRKTLRVTTGSGTRMGAALTRDDIERAFAAAGEVRTVPLNILAMAKRVLAGDAGWRRRSLATLRWVDAHLMKFPPAQRFCGEAVIVVTK